MNTSGLFEQVVKASGLSPLFARSALRRACERAGVAVERLSPAGLRTAMPEIERTLQTFLDSDAERFVKQLKKLTEDR